MSLAVYNLKLANYISVASKINMFNSAQGATFHIRCNINARPMGAPWKYSLSCKKGRQTDNTHTNIHTYNMHACIVLLVLLVLVPLPLVLVRFLLLLLLVLPLPFDLIRSLAPTFFFFFFSLFSLFFLLFFFSFLFFLFFYYCSFLSSSSIYFFLFP